MIQIRKPASITSANEKRLRRAIVLATQTFGLSADEIYATCARGIEDANRRANSSDKLDREYTRRAFPAWIRNKEP